MTTLTCREVYDLLTEIVNEKGRDYRHYGTCEYFAYTGAAIAVPICIIGHLFARLGVNPDDVEEINERSIKAIYSQFPFFPNPGDPEHDLLLSLLAEAQQLQDDGFSWGEVLDTIKFSHKLDEVAAK